MLAFWLGAKGTFAPGDNFDVVVSILEMKIMKILRTVSFKGTKFQNKVQKFVYLRKCKKNVFI